MPYTQAHHATGLAWPHERGTPQLASAVDGLLALCSNHQKARMPKQLIAKEQQIYWSLSLRLCTPCRGLAVGVACAIQHALCATRSVATPSRALHRGEGRLRTLFRARHPGPISAHHGSYGVKTIVYEYVRARGCRRPRRRLALKPVHTAHGAHQIQCIHALLSVAGSLFTAWSLYFTPTRNDDDGIYLAVSTTDGVWHRSGPK